MVAKQAIVICLPAERIVARHARLGEAQHRRVHWPSAPTPDWLVVHPVHGRRLRPLPSVLRLLRLLLLILMLHHGRLRSDLAG